MGRDWRVLGLALAAATLATLPPGCHAQPTATATGDVVLFVDTDAPVPLLASQLRIDLFDMTGVWYASRDVTVPSPSAWPVSFGVVLPDGATSGQVVVRLRAYPAGQVRDYLGYAYQPRPTDDSSATPADIAPAGTPPQSTAPRLIVDGVDVTPPTEPIPSVTIDRLLVVPLTAGVVGSVSATLAGACSGTMAYMRDFGALASCVDTEAQLPAVALSSVDPPLTQPPPSLQGSLAAPYAVPCTGAPRAGSTASDGTPLHDEDLCVQGGVFVLGSYDNALHDPSDDWPPQIAFVPSFYLDRYEVTVGRYRAARAAGLPPGGVYMNDGPLTGAQDSPSACTGSDQPMGREEMPLTCLDPAAARAMCQALGGDLPLEVQWEYATTMSGGRPAKTSYAWGDGSDATPPCQDVIYARGTLEISSFCSDAGFGPAAVTTADHPGGDLSIGLSIVDLGGNASELTLDTFASRGADCWVGAPLLLPSCQPGVGPALTSRGGGWDLTPDQLVASERDSVDGMTPGVGFRCARPGTSP